MNAPISLADRPPSNAGAEQALLGAIMHNAAVADRVRDFLAPEHFSEPAHGRIYEIALKLVDKGAQPSPIALRPFFEHDDALKDVGGPTYLVRLAGAAASLYEANHYAEQIADIAKRRRLIELGQEIADRARDMDAPPAPEQIEQAEAELYGLAERHETRGFVSMEKSTADAMDYAARAARGELHSIATGIRALDRALGGGLHDSDLVILGARPGMGKSALAGGIALACAKAAGSSHGGPAAFFSLEMSNIQLATRLIAAESEVNSEWLLAGVDGQGRRISAEDMRRAGDAAVRLDSLPLWIDDTAGLSVAQVRARARRLKRRKGLALVVVDYLQLMRATQTRKSDNRTADVTEISMGLKAIAKELNVPVLALAQLSRKVEERGDKRPMLADLRESGSIEQDADLVLFLYRESYYLRRDEPDQHDKGRGEWEASMRAAQGVAEIIVAKNRHGATRKVELHFAEEYARFGDLAREQDERLF